MSHTARLVARTTSTVVVVAALATCAPTGDQPPLVGTDEPDVGVSERAPAVVERDVLSVPGPASETVLTRLRPEETGIVHQNFLPPERTGNYLHLGAGVAVGDYDADGLVDVFLPSEAGSSRLYRNMGDWRFRDVTDEAGIFLDRHVQAGRWSERFPTSAVFVDVDNDADLDLFVGAFAGANSLFMNNGDGTFDDVTEQAGLGYVGATTTPTFGDVDRDGDLDLYIATYRPYGLSKTYPPTSTEPEPGLDYDRLPDGRLVPEVDRLYRNDGGVFTDVTAAMGLDEPGWGLAARWAHLNSDLWPDLYVANDFETPDRVLLNDGAGGLEAMAPEAYGVTPHFSMGMDVGDVNNDGLMDVVASDMLSPNRLRRQTQDMVNLMPPGVHPPEGSAPQVMRNALLLNHGDGTMSDVAPYAGTTASDWTWTMKVADVDLDGLQDVLVTNGMVRDEMNYDEELRITLLEQRGETEQALALRRAKPPLLTPNILYRNQGALRFEDVARDWGFDDDGIAHGLGLGDFDNDGDLDIVTNNLNAPAGVYRNETPANRVKVALRGTSSNRYGLGARLTLATSSGTLTRELSSSGGYMSGHEPVAVFGLGDLETAASLTVEWPSGHISTVDDIAANTSLVVTEPTAEPTLQDAARATRTQFREVALDAGVDFVHQERPYDDFAVQALVPERMSQFGPGVAWGDLDADGDEDLYVAGGRGQRGGLFENVGGGRFETLEATGAPVGHEQQAALVLPTVDGGTVLASLSAVEAGSGAPWPAVQRVTGGADVDDVVLDASAGPLAAADFDGDDRLDLFVGSRVRPGAWPFSGGSALFRGTASGFESADGAAPGLGAAGMVTGAVWTDVDGDGDPDLVLATDMGPVRVLANDEGALTDVTSASGLAGLTGRWTGVAAGDVDHDGDMDLLAANQGENTRYRATEDEPYVVYAGDADDDGEVDVIETEWDNGRLYPLRSGIDLGRAISSTIGTRFDTLLGFARADVETVFGDQLAKTERFEAATLAHHVLLNDGGGAFTPLRLPYQAQLQASYGATMEDLDNDGHLDVYLVGNFKGPEPMHTGPYQGGVSVWLRGDGTGGFSPVPVTKSGLSVPEDAKGLAAADYDDDGRVDLAVGLNDGPVRLFHNEGRADHAGITVRLLNTGRDPTGVGATVTLTRGDGLVITREVRAGGSFWSDHGAGRTFGLADTGAPVEIRVRWPDGAEQTAQPDGDEGAMMVIVRDE